MVDEILKKARRRILLVRGIQDSALAAACLLGSFSLVLVLGTRILDWWIALGAGALVLAVALTVSFLRAPSVARIARILDYRCHLADALSTAFHFRDSGLELAAAQRKHAARLAENIDLQAALPLRGPKSLYAIAGFAALASVLFILRFATQQQLSLSSPILQISQDPLSLAAKAGDKAAAADKSKAKPNADDLLARLGDSTSDNPAAQDLATPPGQAVSSGTPNEKAGGDSQASGGKKEAAGDSEATSGAEVGANTPKEEGEQPPSSHDGTPQGGQSAGGKSPSPSESSGLLGKLKDAMSSLMSKMKPQGQPPQGGQQSQQQQQAGNKQQGAGQPSGQAQKGPQGAPSQQQQEGDESASSESDQAAPGKGAGKSNDQNATAKPGSGMGRSDGQKEIHDAEQLAAMGKLSEIIGKRSANITGEMTIENQSGPQQLKTGYTHSAARHGESGGDVSRDEVPVAMQGYVQSYFDQVRKQAAAKAAHPTTP